jgi:hypothetical protein
MVLILEKLVAKYIEQAVDLFQMELDCGCWVRLRAVIISTDYLSIFFLINIFFEIKILSEYISCLRNPNSELMK